MTDMTEPVTSAAMKRLDPDSVARYAEHGYLSPLKLITEEQAHNYRHKLETYERELGHPVQGPQRTKPHLLLKWVDDLIHHDTLLDFVEDLIGPDILCWNTWFWIKEAHSSSYVSWHQDSQYWGLDTDQLVTAWLALSPASLESGCMKVAPGTHKGEGLRHADLYHDDNMLTRGQEIEGIDESSSVAMPLATGEVSLHNVKIAHASGPNVSNDRRIGLSMHFMPTSTRQLNADWDSAVLVRGEDRHGNFELSPRPRYDLDPVTVALHQKATDAMRALLFKDAAAVRPTI